MKLIQRLAALALSAVRESETDDNARAALRVGNARGVSLALLQGQAISPKRCVLVMSALVMLITWYPQYCKPGANV